MELHQLVRGCLGEEGHELLPRVEAQVDIGRNHVGHAVGVEERLGGGLLGHARLDAVAEPRHQGGRDGVVKVRKGCEHLAVALRGEARGVLRLLVEAGHEAEEARVGVHPAEAAVVAAALGVGVGVRGSGDAVAGGVDEEGAQSVWTCVGVGDENGQSVSQPGTSPPKTPNNQPNATCIPKERLDVSLAAVEAQILPHLRIAHHGQDVLHPVLPPRDDADHAQLRLLPALLQQRKVGAAGGKGRRRLWCCSCVGQGRLRMMVSPFVVRLLLLVVMVVVVVTESIPAAL